MDGLFSFVTPHMEADFGLVLLFILGQGLYAMRRAAIVVRAPNPVQTRRQYFAHNWDILLFRSVIEFVLVFYPWRHYPLQTLQNFFGINVLLLANQNSALTAFVLGLSSDILLNWISSFEKLPQWAKNLLQEEIPQYVTEAPPLPQTKPVAPPNEKQT